MTHQVTEHDQRNNAQMQISTKSIWTGRVLSGLVVAFLLF
jgi:hypothetical protein